MKILITGGGGNLGRVLAPALAEKGHEPILMDIRPLDTPYRTIVGSVTDYTDMVEAAQGIDVIVHGAALHGIHVAQYTAHDFWDLNVTGTHNVYEAAKARGIGKVLLCSTMGVYGQSRQERADGFAVMTEALPLLPGTIYGLSKKLCEDIAEYHSRMSGIRTIAYRLGRFVPVSLLRYGFRLLKGGVDDRDVAQAFLLGLENTTITYDVFQIMSEVPFTEEQFALIARNPLMWLEERYPGLVGLVQSRSGNVEELLRERDFTYWAIDKAKRLLGYKPGYNFPEFVEAFGRGDDAYYPFADLPHWGL